MSDEPPEAPGIEVQIVGRNGHEGPRSPAAASAPPPPPLISATGAATVALMNVGPVDVNRYPPPVEIMTDGFSGDTRAADRHRDRRGHRPNRWVSGCGGNATPAAPTATG